MPAPAADWRAITAEALRLLSSASEQLEFERAVPNVDITSEMVSIWFDQVYHPENDEYCQHFTAIELNLLHDFHKCFDSVVDKLPDSRGTVKSWLGSTLWKQVMQVAMCTHESLAGK